MHPELATAVSDAAPQHQVLAQHTVGSSQVVALYLADLDLAFNPLLDKQRVVLEVVAQDRLDQRRRVHTHTQQAQVGQQAFAIELGSATDCGAAQTRQGKHLLGKTIIGACPETRPIAVLAPDREHQPVQAMMEHIQEISSRVAAWLLGKCLLTIKRRQWGPGAK